MKSIVTQTDFAELKLLKRGKVRDIYDLGDSLLMVATDRISAFDVVMPNPIPDKGEILTRISLFWFERMAPLVPNHVISSNVDDYPDVCRPYADSLRGRSMRVRKAEPLPVECIVRGYLSGSGWSSYRETGAICDVKLPEGLVESDKLPEPVYTPSTKAEVGLHDINIDFEATIRKLGRALAEKVKTLSLAIYRRGAEYAEKKGIIIADTKFEFGLIGEELILIDEVLTPDSSRFWPRSAYRPGGAQQSFDKQYLRDYLLSINWAKKPPAPELPEDVVQNTRRKYLEALEMLTGSQNGL